MDSIEKREAARTSKPFRLLDGIILAVLIAVTVLAVVFSYRRKGASVEIVSPSFQASFPLNVDRTVKLENLTVVIEKGSVYVKGATCPDKICERTGRIKVENRSIVCLPNRVTVTVKGDGQINGSTGQV